MDLVTRSLFSFGGKEPRSEGCMLVLFMILPGPPLGLGIPGLGLGSVAHVTEGRGGPEVLKGRPSHEDV